MASSAQPRLDIARQRSLLFSARMRFSPHVQPVREAAIDRILEQNLLVAGRPQGISLHELEAEGGFALSDGTQAIAHWDLQQSLRRLETKGRVLVGRGSSRDARRYRLSEGALAELSQLQRSSEDRLKRVTDRLFRHAPGGATSYLGPFLDVLVCVFSQLGEAYVRVLKREIEHGDLLRVPRLQRALEEARQGFPEIDPGVLERGVSTFFREADPDYDAIKWNLAQNHYVAKALGLDPNGQLLSQELFGRAVFYLDTNVIIPALEPLAAYHQSFQVLRQACAGFGAEVKVCQISLDELRNVLQKHRDLISRVGEKIPDALAPKVRGVFFEMFRRALSAGSPVDLDLLFATFGRPMEALSEYGVERVDDAWFTEATQDAAVQKLAERIRTDSEVRRPWRPKRMGTATHDALLLSWVQAERERSGRDVYVITLDTSLPTVSKEGTQNGAKALAITLDALLQWISPIALGDTGEEEQVARVFSDAVKYLLLPQDSFFELQDFLVFAEMEYSCKELPPEDVENCIRYVKAEAPNLDPTVPADREKIAHEYAKFFADPGRKYQETLARVEAEKAQEIARIEAERTEERRTMEGALDAARERHQSEVDGLRDTITATERALSESERRRVETEAAVARRELRRSAAARALVAATVALAVLASAIYFSWKYGKGDNAVQRILNLKELVLGGLGVGTIASWFIIGKQRLSLLGWPWNKVFKSD